MKKKEAVAGNGPDTQKLEGVQRSLLGHEEPTEALRLWNQFLEQTFDRDPLQGSVLIALRLTIPDLDERFNVSGDTLTEMEKRQSGTKQLIKTAPQTADGQPVRFAAWVRRDQIMAVVLFLALIMALALGMANVFSNLMASGLPIFLDSPWLAWTLSGLLPLSSLAFKSVTSFIELDKNRRRYALCVFTSTLAVFLAWSVLFAQNFAGVSASFDFDSLIQDTNATSLVWCQMMVELLAATSLALALEDLVLRYAPETWISNPDWLAQEKKLKTHIQTHETLRTQWSEAHAQLQSLEAARAAFIQEHTALFTSQQRRFAAL